MESALTANLAPALVIKPSFLQEEIQHTKNKTDNDNIVRIRAKLQ